MTEPFVPNMRAQMQSYYTILNDGVNYLKILFYKEKTMKKKTIYKCSVCDYESIGYLGKCPVCNSWSTLVETIIDEKQKSESESRL
jgi:lipopolysaccharide biosynthesis regulator YciM